jgi:hypothetical protein
MASIFFTERLPGISKWQVVSCRSLVNPWRRLVRSLLPGKCRKPGKAALLIIDANCVDHKLDSSTGFLKSRVYAKLLTRLILKRYQTFNRQVEEVELNTA